MYERTYGKKYDRNLDIAEIAKRVRKEIKVALPGFKVSVRISRYSGGQSLDAKIKEVPPGFVINNHERVRLEKEDPLWPSRAANYPRHTETARAVEQTIGDIIEAYNYDGSDIQTDYFDVNFYSSVSWDYELESQDKARVLADLEKPVAQAVAESKKPVAQGAAESKKCGRCQSDRVVAVSAKCSDLCHASYGGVERDGYVPTGIGVDNGEDYLAFAYCLDCGQIQGDWPRPDPDFASGDC